MKIPKKITDYINKHCSGYIQDDFVNYVEDYEEDFSSYQRLVEEFCRWSLDKLEDDFERFPDFYDKEYQKELKNEILGIQHLTF